MSLTKEFSLLGILALAGAGFSLCIGWAAPPWHGPALAAGEIRAADARGLDILWLDARPAAAYREAHVPGALWLDPEDRDAALLTAVQAWLEKPRPVVVYCAGHSCTTSKELAEWLRSQLPEAEIHSLQGGWAAWRQLD